MMDENRNLNNGYGYKIITDYWDFFMPIYVKTVYFPRI